MNLKGVNIKGVNIVNHTSLPLTPIEVPYTVKTHKYGADATWSHSTDLYYPTVERKGIDAEINALKYNLQMTVFAHWEFSGSVVNELKGFYNSGRCGVGSYDYAGKHYVDGVLNDDTYLDYIKNQYEWVKNNFGYYPSVASYAYSNQTFKDLLREYYLGVRYSGYDLNEYSYDLLDTGYFATTTRQADMVGDRSTVLAECSTALSNAIANGGWYRDFTHWHSCEGTMLEDYFRTQRETIGSNDVAVIDYLTAIEYMKFRQGLNKINFHTYESEVYISADVNRHPVLSRDMETTLSVEIDTTDTILAGKELVSNYGIQKLSTNVFIVEVPYNGYATLSESTTGKYLDFSLPSVTSADISNGKLNVSTSKETKVTVFSVPKGQELYNATIVGRNNVFSDSHAIDIGAINTTTYDIYVGFISEEKQSILHLV